MAKPATEEKVEKKQRFTIPTRDFCRVWSKRLKKEKEGDTSSWRVFVLEVMEMASKAHYNASYEHSGEHDMMKEEGRYQFMSEKAYTKAKNVQRKLLKEHGNAPALPCGWKERNGSKDDARIMDWGEIAGMFD